MTTVCAIVVICAATLHVVESAVAADQLVDIGCVDTPRLGRRCFTLYKVESTWSEAAAACSELTDGRLAVVEHTDVEHNLTAALEQHGYRAWTAGRELDQQLEWSWTNGYSLDATETAVTGVNVELTSDATVYEDCAAVTVSSQPEWNLTLTSHECRSTLSHLLCQTVNVSDEESCSMSENGGLLLDNSCYVLTASSDMQQQQQQAAVSWFKALSHCVSLGSSLASIDVNSTGSVSRLAEYLSSSGLEGQPLWIGLHRRPWVWIQRFDPASGEAVSTTPILYSDWLEPEEPNSSGGESCLSVGCGDDGRCGWSDESCNEQLSYVCEHSEALTTATTEMTALNTTNPTSVPSTVHSLPTNITTSTAATTTDSSATAAANASTDDAITITSTSPASTNTTPSSNSTTPTPPYTLEPPLMLSTTSASELRGTSTANATENNSTSTPATGFTLHETGSTSTTGLGTNATATVTPQTMVTMLGNGSTSIPEPGSNTPVTWFTTPGTNFTAVSENGSMMTGIGSTVPSNSSISETEITPALETVSPVPGNGYTSATEAGSANTSGAMSGNGSVTGITIPATSPLPGETVSMLSTASDWSTSGEIVATDFPLLTVVAVFSLVAITAIAIAAMVYYYKFSYRRRGYIKQP